MENFRLKVFRAVAKHLNFRKASEELCLTQPAVTLQIKTLEQHLGVQLFDRSGARISLTSAGALLLKYARKIEELESAAQAAYRSLPGSIAATCASVHRLTIAQYILPHLLGAFQQQHPSGAAARHHLQYGARAGRAWWCDKISLGFIEGPTLRRDVHDRNFSGR